jgi:hypothetical protein
MNKLIILDYVSGDVDIYTLEENYDNPNVEAILESLNYDIENCAWMITRENIVFRKGVIRNENSNN